MTVDALAAGGAGLKAKNKLVLLTKSKLLLMDGKSEEYTLWTLSQALLFHPP
jgi:hypothetical protein